MNSESSSTKSSPETQNYIICYICLEHILREKFIFHYEQCKTNYLESEQSKYYPINEPENINELMKIISNNNSNFSENISNINYIFKTLHDNMKTIYIKESKKSMSPSEYYEYQKEIRFKKLLNDEYEKNNNDDNNKKSSKKRTRFISFELKNITEDELKNAKKFSINF